MKYHLYYVIWRQNDEPYVQWFSKEEFLKHLNDGEFGNIVWTEEVYPVKEWPANTGLVIKGQAITPFQEEVVVKFGID